MQAYNRKAAVSQQLQTKHTNNLLFYKSNRIKEYILKSEEKIKWLKNLEEKKNYVHTVYLQVNRSNIIQVWLAVQGQAEATKVHIIQHCMTFSFVNPKRQNTFQETTSKVTLKSNVCRSEQVCFVRFEHVFIKTSRAFWVKHSFQFFARFKKKID